LQRHGTSFFLVLDTSLYSIYLDSIGPKRVFHFYMDSLKQTVVTYVRSRYGSIVKEISY